MQHSHTGATEGQSLEVTEMVLLLVPGWAQICPRRVLDGLNVVLCMV